MFKFGAIICSRAIICHIVEIKGDIYLNNVDSIVFMDIDQISIFNIQINTYGLLISGCISAKNNIFGNFFKYDLFFNFGEGGFSLQSLFISDSATSLNFAVKITGNMMFENDSLKGNI